MDYETQKKWMHLKQYTGLMGMIPKLSDQLK